MQYDRLQVKNNKKEAGFARLSTLLFKQTITSASLYF
jgi:hypothetical protein